MKTGIYVIIAVTIGVLMISTLPNQLTQIYSHTNFNVPGEGFNNNTLEDTEKILNDTTNNFGSTSIQNKTWSLNTLSNDIGYYSIWVLNLLIALSIYYLTKKYLM
ncbi:hypothetical protein JW865_02080 [Candidatus Bathyarchaeota archaeon]|nr:hypothetical protein [Candidatus Bathyarchaeota archaeon]